MNKIIPFEEEIVFKTNINEITSISLERELSLDDNKVNGEFIVSGDYKITDTSTTVESFEYHLPIEVNLDEKYDVNNSSVDVDDFYYEVINNNILKVNIDVKIENIKERELVEMNRNISNIAEEIQSIEESDDKEKENQVIEEVKDIPDTVNSLFNNFNNDDTYISYNIYIVRDGDTIDNILEKYQVTEEELKKYNDLSSIVIGSKIVIPNQ